MNPIKLIFSVLMTLVLTVVAAVLALLFLVNPNDFKPEIEKLAAEQNVELSIEGDLAWSFWPKLGISSGKMSVKPPMEAITAPIRFESMKLSVKIAPLIDKEIVVDEINIQGGMLALVDAKTKNQVQLSNLSLSGENINTNNQPFAINAAFDLETSQPKQNIQAVIDATIAVDKKFEKISLSQSHSKINYAAASTNNIVLPLVIDAAGDINLASQTADLKSLSVALHQLKVNGSMAVSNLDTTPVVDGKLTINLTNINDFLKKVGQEPVVVSDSSVLSRLDINTNIKGSAEKINLDPISMQLDNTQIKGKISADLSQDIPFVDLVLAVDNIVADRYLAPNPEEAKPKSTEPKKPGTGSLQSDDVVLSKEQFVGVPGNYRIGIQKLVYNKMNLANMKLLLSISRDGLANLQQLSVDLYDGNLNMKGKVDARTATPTVAMNTTMTNLNLDPLLRDTQQTNEPMAIGKLSFNGDITSKGSTPRQLTAALNGNANFTSDSIEIMGVDLKGMLGPNMLKLLGGHIPKILAEGDRTILNNINGKAVITNGVVNNTILTATSLCTSFKGSGKADLLKETINYDMGVTLPSKDPNPACEEINPRIQDVRWPVLCNGKFDDDPAEMCGVDKDAMSKIVGKILEKELKRKMDEAVDKKKEEAEEKAKEKLREKIDDKAKDLFKGLFGK